MSFHGVRERRAVVIGVLIAAAVVAVGVSIFVHVSGGGTKTGDETSLFGRWSVTRIDVGSPHTITVPLDYGAEFLWTPAGPQRVPTIDGGWEERYMDASLDASDGISSYGCFYTRVGDELTLNNCVVTPNVPVKYTELEQTVVAAFERAFRTARMTVANAGEGVLKVSLGDTVFTLVKAK
jgi:hypothetical protein